MEQLSMKWENGEVPCIVCDEDIQIRSYSPKTGNRSKPRYSLSQKNGSAMQNWRAVS